MKIKTPTLAVLAAMLLVLTGCDETPVAPEGTALTAESQLTVQELFAADGARRSQCVNNLKQLGIPIHAPRLAHIVAPSQETEDDQGGEVRFRAEIHVWTEEGDACGQAQLEFDGGSLAVSIHRVEGEINALYDLGIVNGTTWFGEAVVCSERSSDCETLAITMDARDGLNDDEPIFQLHGGGAYSGAFPVRIRVVVSGRDGNDDGVR